VADGRALRAQLEAAQARRRVLELELARPFDPALREARAALELELRPLRIAAVKAGRSVESLRRSVTSIESGTSDLVVKQRGAVARREVSLLTATLTLAAFAAGASFLDQFLDASREVAVGLACLSGFLSGLVYRVRLKAD
jgi:hypothetical protein